MRETGPAIITPSGVPAERRDADGPGARQHRPGRRRRVFLRQGRMTAAETAGTIRI